MTRRSQGHPCASCGQRCSDRKTLCLPCHLQAVVVDRGTLHPRVVLPAGWSQKRAANALGVTRSTVWGWCAGESPVPRRFRKPLDDLGAVQATTPRCRLCGESTDAAHPCCVECRGRSGRKPKAVPVPAPVRAPSNVPIGVAWGLGYALPPAPERVRPRGGVQWVQEVTCALCGQASAPNQPCPKCGSRFQGVAA